MHDIYNNIGIAQALTPQTIQASALDSGNIDTRGAEALCVVVLVGAVADTLDASHRIDVKIEHADDDGTGSPGTYAACADTDVQGFTGLSSGIFKSIAATGDKSKRYAIGYAGGKRFVKVTATPVSISTGGAIAMLTLKGNPSLKPVSNT
jgi:hypothetical protein